MANHTDIELNHVLDALIAQHGLQSRREARRFLREQLDLKRRSEITQPGRFSGIRQEHGRYQVISPSGLVLPTEERTPEVKPFPIHPELPPEDQFQAAIREKQSSRSPIQRKRGKSLPIPKNPTQTDSISARATRSRSATSATSNGNGKRGGSKPRTAPRPGSKAEFIVQALIKHDWDARKARDEIWKSPVFDNYTIRDTSRDIRASVLAAVIVVRKRWYGRL